MTICSLPTQGHARRATAVEHARQRQAKRRREEAAAAAPAPKRTRTVLNRDGFDVKMETFDPSKMSSEERCVQRERLLSDLAVVRDVLKKTELVGAAASSSAAHGGKNGRSLAAKRRSEAVAVEADREDYKRRKTSPLVEYIEPTMMLNKKESLAGSLSSLTAELPVPIIEVLQQHCSDNADPNGDIEVDIHHVPDGTLFKLSRQMEEFIEDRKQRQRAKPESSEKARLDVTGASRSSTHLREDSKLVKEEEEEEEVDICGDVSPSLVGKNVLITSSSHSSPSSSESDSDSESSSSDSEMDSGSESESDERAVSPPEFVGSGNVGADVSTVCHSSPTHLRKDGEHVGEEEFVDICGTSPTLADHDDSNKPDVTVAKTRLGQQQKEQKAFAPDVKLSLGHEKVTRLNLERAKARQALLEMEVSAEFSDVIHPLDMQRLGIAAIEHIVSSEDDMSPKHSPDSPLCFVRKSRSLLQQLGLFMKSEDGGVEGE